MISGNDAEWLEKYDQQASFREGQAKYAEKLRRDKDNGESVDQYFKRIRLEANND